MVVGIYRYYRSDQTNNNYTKRTRPSLCIVLRTVLRVLIVQLNRIVFVSEFQHLV